MTSTIPCLYPPHPVSSMSDAYALADRQFGGWTHIYINGAGVCTAELADGFDVTGQHRQYITIRDFCQVHFDDNAPPQDEDDYDYDPDEGSIYHGCR